MGRMVRCAFCQNLVDKDESIRYNDKNFHKLCYGNYLDRKELIKYVAKLFGFKNEEKPGPKINSQLKLFITKYPFTYKGILRALTYHFEVKNGSKNKADEGIGIVPYVYEEAQEYYNKLTNKQEKVAKTVEKLLEQKPVVMKIRKNNEKKEIPLFNLEDL